jgi:hypothetical protein
MCSSHGSDRVGGGADLVNPMLGRHAPTTLAATLHGTLDRLLEADLSLLSDDEHTQLVTSLVKAQSRLQAATLDSVAAFDAADVASTSRHRTSKRWIERRTQLSAGASAALVRQARAMRDHLPETRDALASGSITPQHAAVIATVVRTVGEEHARSAEPILVSLAQREDPATVGRATAAILAEVHPEKAEKALHDAYERRGLRVRVVGQHGYLDGVFDLESTEIVQSALMPLMSPAGDDDKRTSEQCRADALLDIVTHHLAHGDMPVQGGHRPHLSVVVDADQIPPAAAGSVGGSPADGAVQAGSRGWAGVISLPWTSAAVPAAAARRWICDAVVTPVVARLLGRSHPGNPTGVNPAWLPLAVGRSQRTATPAQLKALSVRDGGCIHPGCTRTSAFCDAHHVVHWADGGVTDVSNLVFLCRHHHRTLHAGYWAVEPDPGTPGLFWIRDHEGLRPAQNSTDRSPPSPIAA